MIKFFKELIEDDKKQNEIRKIKEERDNIFRYTVIGRKYRPTEEQYYKFEHRNIHFGVDLSFYKNDTFKDCKKLLDFNGENLYVYGSNEQIQIKERAIELFKQYGIRWRDIVLFWCEENDKDFNAIMKEYKIDIIANLIFNFEPDYLIDATEQHIENFINDNYISIDILTKAENKELKEYLLKSIFEFAHSKKFIPNNIYTEYENDKKKKRW
ncbi:MAG: hypothetical protein IJA82_07230 [Clostridia bacterium]|nr:hypothetical protein [Clostridia bacterium]